jgi:hypothetical protein
VLADRASRGSFLVTLVADDPFFRSPVSASGYIPADGASRGSFLVAFITEPLFIGLVVGPFNQCAAAGAMDPILRGDDPAERHDKRKRNELDYEQSQIKTHIFHYLPIEIKNME